MKKYRYVVFLDMGHVKFDNPEAARRYYYGYCQSIGLARIDDHGQAQLLLGKWGK
jgi:hypothetical protein